MEVPVVLRKEHCLGIQMSMIVRSTQVESE